jgi:hypothetical protein
MASNAKALSFLSGDLSLSGSEVSINVAGSVQSDSITGSTITMKNTGSTIVASDGTTAVLSESGGVVTVDADVSTIGSATISGGSITGTEIDLKSSGTTIFASDGTTAVLSESGGVVTLTADEANVGSNALVVDASGNVGIGTSSPGSTFPLTVYGLNAGLAFQSSTSTSGLSQYSNHLYLDITRAGTAGDLIVRNGVGLNNRMRIDSNGNVLVGTESSALASTSTLQGIALNGSDNTTQMSRAGTILYLNRISTDGTILDFRKNGTSVGIIGVATEAAGSGIYIGKSDTCLSFQTRSDNAIAPFSADTGTVRDNAIDLGVSVARFDDIYATNGTIQTSDANEKEDIVISDLSLDFINQLNPVSYRFIGKTRTHYGLIAQEIETLLSTIGKDTAEFAGFIKSPVTDEDGNETGEYRYGLRYTEFISPIIKAIQEQQTLIESQQTQIDALTVKTQEQDFTIASLISRIEALENP